MISLGCLSKEPGGYHEDQEELWKVDQSYFPSSDLQTRTSTCDG